jgi:hypothetical protein
MHVQEMNEWELVGHRASMATSGAATSSTGKIYSVLEIVIMVQRSHMWYTVNVGAYMATQVNTHA